MTNEDLDNAIEEFMKWRKDPIKEHQDEDTKLKLRELFKRKGI